jgi:hypothetical protein
MGLPSLFHHQISKLLKSLKWRKGMVCLVTKHLKILTITITAHVDDQLLELRNLVQDPRKDLKRERAEHQGLSSNLEIEKAKCQGLSKDLEKERAKHQGDLERERAERQDDIKALRKVCCIYFFAIINS